MKKQIVFLGLLLLAGCSRQEQEWSSITSPASEHIRLESVQIKKVELDSIYCSGVGFSAYVNTGQICWFDSYFGNLYTFDLSGKLTGKQFGAGNGPGELRILNPFGFFLDETGDLTLVGNNLDVETHTVEGDEDYFTILYHPNGVGDSDSFSTYTHSILPDLHKKGDNVLYGVYSEHPNFNMVSHPSKFVREAYHIAQINCKTHKGSVIVQGFPKAYYKNPHMMFSFSFIRFDLLPDDKLLVNFEATPELYVCDPKGHPIRAFGSPGKDMDQEYLSVSSFEPEEISKFRINRETKGYYGAIWVKGNKVFRTYKKGGGSPVDGLQIYEDEILIADLDVPKDFSVIGLNGNTLISSVFLDEECERLYCYEVEME